MEYRPTWLCEMKIYTMILNLRRRQERRRRMLRVIPHGLEAEFTSDWIVDFDWRNGSKYLDEFGLFPWKIQCSNSWWNRPLKKGEVACAVAHMLCWRHAVEKSSDIFLILEDDVWFDDGFDEKLAKGLQSLTTIRPQWELLYLGREPLAPDLRIANGIVRPGYSFGAYAYMMTGTGARKLVESTFDKAIIPVDEFLPAMYGDHPRADVRREFPKRIVAYAFDPSIVFPLEESIFGSDTEDSVFVMDRDPRANSDQSQ
jgi:glycosyl transferase, family 25